MLTLLSLAALPSLVLARPTPSSPNGAALSKRWDYAKYFDLQVRLTPLFLRMVVLTT
jgi:hypothetical protein